MIFPQYRIIFFVVFIVIFLSACQQRSNNDLVKFVNETYEDEKPEIEPLPPIIPYEEFIYSADDLADPFSKENVLAGTTDDSDGDGADGIDESRRKEPLEAFPLDGLRLDGVLEFRGIVSAIIRSPDGDSVPLSVGNYVGLNNGKIISISSEEQVLEIEETVRNATGNWVKRIVKMTGDEPEGSTKR